MTDDRRSRARTPWKTLSTRSIYANQWIRVREDVAELPDGRRTIYGVVEGKPAIGVLPFVEALRMVERSEIQDSISVIAILHAARRRAS